MEKQNSKGTMSKKALRKYLDDLKERYSKTEETIEQLILDKEFLKSEIKDVMSLLHSN